VNSNTRSIIQTVSSIGNQWIFPQPMDSATRNIYQTIQAKQPYSSHIKFINIQSLI